MALIPYVPILKWSRGEQDALQNLSAGPNMYPLLELNEGDTDADAFISRLTNCYTGPVYLDYARTESVAVVLDILKAARAIGITIWPVVDSLGLIESVSELADRIAYRISVMDSMDTEYSETFRALGAQTRGALVDLILDAEAVGDGRATKAAYIEYKSALGELLASGFKPSRTVICLTSFPESLSGIPAGQNSEYQRYDFEVMTRLYNEFSQRIPGLSYSDYGVTKFTETDLDFARMRGRVLAKIKYTTESAYRVLKGKNASLQDPTTRTYNDMCRELAGADYFCGPEFSYGDRKISEKAHNAQLGPGNATQWVTYTTSHHIAMVLRQLANLSSV